MTLCPIDRTTGVSLVALPHVVGTRDRALMTVAPGASVAELVAMTLPGLRDHSMARVTIGDQVIAPEFWHRVRPRAGTQVAIRVVAGDANTRMIIGIVVSIAALAAGQFWVGPAIASSLALGATGTSIAVGLTSLALVAASTLAFNALVPLQTPSTDEDKASPSHSIQGFQNPFSLDGVIPNVLGLHRFAPPHAALPWTEIVGDDQYINAMFNFGYGPVDINNIRLGDNYLWRNGALTDHYDDVQIEVLEGYPSDPRVTLYPQQVIEDSTSVDPTPQGFSIVWVGDDLGIGLAEQPSVRTTARDVVSSSVDFTFPGGLVEFDDEGEKKPLFVDIRIRQRAVGATTWLLVNTYRVMAASKDPLRRNFKWTHPSRGQWEVEVARLTPERTDIKQVDKFAWTALRSFRPEYPIDFDKPLALVAVRIRATDQINGMLNNLNADVHRVCKDWDAASGTWIVRATSNPASLYRYILQGAANADPKSDSEINLDDLAVWHEYCAAKGLEYNRIIDFDSALWEALRDCAGAGRASPHYSGSQWSVVIDRPKTQVVGHLSPRNTWGFAGERSYVNDPDAFRVSFFDETRGYEKSERVVTWPTFTGTVDEVEISEEISLPGVTDPDAIFREARKRQYEIINRPDRYTIHIDLANLVLERGDLAVLSHDVLDRAQVAARVVLVSDNTITIDTSVEMVAGTGYACRFQAADGTTMLKAIQTTPGETVLLRTDGGAMPSIGDLAMFGISTRVTREVIVIAIEAMENLSARLTLSDHAPEIESLVDGDAIPDWTGRFGDPVVEPVEAPAVPTITEIVSGVRSIGNDYDFIYSAIVHLVPGTGGATPVTYEVQHRLDGAVDWETLTVPVGEGFAGLSSYIPGDDIEVRARALSFYGVPSGYSAITAHTVLAWPDTFLLRENGVYLQLENGKPIMLEGAV